MDGIEAAEQIQSIRKTPIIFCTGYDDPEIRNRANALEPLAFFNKPLDFSALVSILDGMVDKCEARGSRIFNFSLRYYVLPIVLSII